MGAGAFVEEDFDLDEEDGGEDNDRRALFRSPDEVAQLDTEAAWNPSPDQTISIDKLIEALKKPDTTCMLRGATGSGKTTTARALLRRLNPKVWRVVLLAPTWRAANRLSEVVGKRARSLHSYIYGKPVQERQCSGCTEWTKTLLEPVEIKRREVVEGIEVEVDGVEYRCEHCKRAYRDTVAFPERMGFNRKMQDYPEANRLVLLDEASMISQTMLLDMQEVLYDGRTRIALVGDPNQLPPVSTAGQLEQGVDFETPTAALDHVHRQAEGNPTLVMAHTLKTSPMPSELPQWPFPTSWRGDRRLAITWTGLNEPATWSTALRCKNEDVVLITVSNATRAELNIRVREQTGLARMAREAGTIVAPGDRLLVRVNCLAAEVYNGELHLVELCGRVEPGTALLDMGSRAAGRSTNLRDVYADEQNQVLGAGALAVWRVRTYPVGSPEGTRREGYIVTIDGKMETDYLRAGDKGGKQKTREISRLWTKEYEKALSVYQDEMGDELLWLVDRKLMVAALRRAQTSVQRTRIIARLSTMCRPFSDMAARQAQAEALAHQGDVGGAAALLVDSKRAQAAEMCGGDLVAYCQHAYGAIDPRIVWTADFGECLTGHAMQGSQAKHVGVVADGSFMGMWMNAKVDAMRWMYTALTRTTENVSIFRIKKGAT